MLDLAHKIQNEQNKLNFVLLRLFEMTWFKKNLTESDYLWASFYHECSYETESDVESRVGAQLLEDGP